ncbi:bile acid:sodium symporter family protein [bacterium]|nr:bile acid:sodium symporter family protein [bacterium]
MNRFITIFNKLFIVWVILAGVSAYYFPHLFLHLKKYMELFFAITMFGIGMILKPADFIHIFRHYKAVLIGVLAQFTIMPFSAWLLSKCLSFSREFSLGLILAGSAPGAMASNVLSYLAGADVAYSVSLTTVSTLLSPLLTPLLTLTLASELLKIPFWNMMISVAYMVLVPLIIGFFVKWIFHDKVEPVVKVFPAISTLFIAFICSLVIALNRNFILKIDGFILAGVLLLNLSGLGLGYLVGKLAGFEILRRRALSIEIGMQNAGLGSVIALKHFNEQVALPAVIFVFICIFSASFLVSLWSNSST